MINGLPLHPLIVHLTVVLLPVTAIPAVVYVARPSLQERLRLPLLVLAVVSVAAVWLTSASGEDLRNRTGLSGPLMDTHAHRAHLLKLATLGFGLVAVVIGFFDRRAGWWRGLLHALLVIGAVAVVVLCVMTGDAGARLVYGGTQ